MLPCVKLNIIDEEDDESQNLKINVENVEEFRQQDEMRMAKCRTEVPDHSMCSTAYSSRSLLGSGLTPNHKAGYVF